MTDTARAAAGQLGLPLGGRTPWWGRPQAVLLRLEHGGTTAIIATLDMPALPRGLGPAVAAALGLPAEAVLLAPSGARPGLDPGAVPVPALAAALAGAARGLATALVPVQLHALDGHRWNLARLQAPATSAWGARLERRAKEFAGCRPDAALTRLGLERNGRDVPPGLPWERALVDARLTGFTVRAVATGKLVFVFAAVRASLPRGLRGARPATGPVQLARESARERIWRKERPGPEGPPQIALAAGISADAELDGQGDRAAATTMAEAWGQAVAAAALDPGAPLTGPLRAARVALVPAGAPVRDGAAHLPATPAPRGPVVRSDVTGWLAEAPAPRPEDGAAPATETEEGAPESPAPEDAAPEDAAPEDAAPEGPLAWAQLLDLGGRRIVALPAQLSTGLAGRVAEDTALVGPCGGFLGAMVTPREHDHGTVGGLAPWGRESGRWLLAQLPEALPPLLARASGVPETPETSGVPEAPGFPEDPATDAAPPATGREAVLRLRRHNPGPGQEPQLRLEVEWVGPPVDTVGPWLRLLRDGAPVLLGGVPVDDLHRAMLVESQPHAGTTRWRLRWSAPLPRRWSGRRFTAELGPWSTTTAPRALK